MMANHHGDFIWYELMTTHADDARDFYQKVVGWNIEGAPSGPMDYRMITASEGNVAGLLPLTSEMVAGGARSAWIGYVGVDDVDKMVASVEDGGGATHMPAMTMDGVGRMAMLADPQGANFYVMRGAVEDGESHAFSYDRPRIGHCAWNELATSDPAAALHFYGQRFGWVKDGEMDMGPMGTYHFIRHAGRAPDGSPPGHGMLGAVYRKVEADPVSHWLFYFRVPDIDDAVAQIRDHGGSFVQEPIEIPGGDFSLVATDPQGAHFGLVGERKG
jgi:uncharacterized protein